MTLDAEHNMMIYNDIFELNYEILNSIGLSTDNNGYVFDQDTKQPIMVFGKHLKASISPTDIKYPGPTDIMLDVLKNNQLMKLLLGYQIEKKVANNEMTCMAHYIDEIKNDPRTSVVVKYDALSGTSSGWYNNNCLAYADMIIKLNYVNLPDYDADVNINLLDFDTLE